MLLAGFFAGALFLGLLVGDWVYFIRLTPDAVRYGCRVATRPDQWPGVTLDTVRERFGPDGILMLPHGVAWWYPDLSQIAIRPQYRLFSRKFRTAWPVKGLIHVSPHETALVTHCVKRIPWSSALITVIWFAVVLLGSLTFVVQYALEGGFTTLGAAFLGIGITGLAGMVALFGIVTVTLSYRLEDSRLMQVYDELRAVMTPPSSS
ncbi:conserved membrane hypothetical protein [Candidatus Nitrospira nitrosa]|uniref:Transmembrane protein n=1 Tax=Candidatus Nitrospira nitrosa TaxID=1742972 RepID=A0A0S4L959_9BACT|nr:hypothetical protein [Candidatus Nitrospira nitrosa]CUS33759.1 conserved membrane hypothetical protein [Candidatus Nitrospira nitrosa]